MPVFCASSLLTPALLVLARFAADQWSQFCPYDPIVLDIDCPGPAAMGNGIHDLTVDRDPRPGYMWSAGAEHDVNVDVCALKTAGLIYNCFLHEFSHVVGLPHSAGGTVTDHRLRRHRSGHYVDEPYIAIGINDILAMHPPPALRPVRVPAVPAYHDRVPCRVN